MKSRTWENSKTTKKMRKELIRRILKVGEILFREVIRMTASA